MYHIAPSMLCANQLNLERDIVELNGLGVDWFHLDVMDGSFVPNLAFGTDAIRQIKTAAKMPLYAHLMAVCPERHVEIFAGIGVDYFCFHIETTNNPFRLCSLIKESGMKACCALNPATPLSVLNDLAAYVDTVTLMSVEPGFSGQKFLPFMPERIKAARAILGDKVLIEVDGGIDNALAVKCMNAGCDIVVGGYFILFKSNGTISEHYNLFRQETGGI